MTTAQAKAYIAAVSQAGMTSKTIASSFSPRILATFRAADPKVTIKSSLITNNNVRPISEIKACGSTYYMPNWQSLTAAKIQTLQQAGIKVWVWGAETHADYLGATKLKPDAVVVDSVGAFKAWQHL